MNTKRKKKLPAIILPLLFAAALLVAVTLASGALGSRVDDDQLALYETTIRRYAVQCYAIEGFFPQNLSYLETNYGLRLNSDKYVYHYIYIGANMMPEIRVFLINSK